MTPLFKYYINEIRNNIANLIEEQKYHIINIDKADKFIYNQYGKKEINHGFSDS
jgi:hypothetical protein